jgi:uncharacterized damage-inducible protein DinB
VRLFEHNHWANQQIIKACAALTDEQLDAPPTSATYGSIRSTLTHLVGAQYSYLRTLTLPLDERREGVSVAWGEVEASEHMSSAALTALARDPSGIFQPTPLRTRDGYFVEPFVVMVQIINHATEHREQIKSMLTALGVTPPEIDGWQYGFATNTLVPISPETAAPPP